MNHRNAPSLSFWFGVITMVGCAPVVDTETRLGNLEWEVKALQQSGMPEAETAYNDWGCRGWIAFALVRVESGGKCTVLWKDDDDEVPKVKVHQLAQRYKPGKVVIFFRPNGPYWVPTVQGESGWRVDKSDVTLKVSVHEDFEDCPTAVLQ